MMNVETATRTIQLVIAPVVMVSACAILLGGLLARFSAISERAIKVFVEVAHDE